MTKITKYLLICITSIFVLLTILKSFYFSTKNGGTDLRIRVVGSRLLATDHSPYFYNWTPADGEYYLDPSDQASSLLNGNVVTPAMLYLIYPVSVQPYPIVRILWTIILFILASFTLYLLLKGNNGRSSLLVTCIILTGILCTDIWLLNVERGQVYIFYTFLFAAMYSLYTSKLKHGELLSGFITGLFILFRPFAGIIGLVFLLNGKRNWVFGCVTGFIVGCLLFVLPRPSLWKEYFQAMGQYASQYTGHSAQPSNTTEYVRPASVEGTNNLSQAQPFNIRGLDTLYKYFKKAGVEISQSWLYMLYGLAISCLFYFFSKRKRNNVSAESLFLLAFLLYILAELFVTVPRGQYNLIQWIFPLTLIALRSKPTHPVFVLLITGLLLLHNFPFVVPYQATMAELIFIGITIYCIFSTTSFDNSKLDTATLKAT